MPSTNGRGPQRVGASDPLDAQHGGASNRDNKQQRHDQQLAQAVFVEDRIVGHIWPDRCGQVRAADFNGRDIGLFNSEIAAAHALYAGAWRRGNVHG